MLLITCPVTGTDELVADRRIRAVVNHPTHIALHVACPCGAVHVYRTGRRWEAARRGAGDGPRQPAARATRSTQLPARAAQPVAARPADTPVHA